MVDRFSCDGITTPNANNPNDTTNITDEVVLNEISWLKVTIGTLEVTHRRGMDFDKTDHGRNDGVLWINFSRPGHQRDHSSRRTFQQFPCVHGVNNRHLLPWTVSARRWRICHPESRPN